MEALFDKGSLEVYYNDGSEKFIKQTYSNLKNEVTSEALGQMHSALATVSAHPVEAFVVVERTRYINL